MAAGGEVGAQLDAAFHIIESNLGQDWIQLALKLGLKFNFIQEILNSREENLMWRSRTVLEKWRHGKGKEATVEKLLTALERAGRQDLVHSVEEDLCRKGVSSLQLDKEQEVKTSSRDQDKENKENTKEDKTSSSDHDQDKKKKESTKPTQKKRRKVKSRQGKARLSVKRLEFARNAVQSIQLAKEMRMRCCYIKIEDSVKEELVSGAQHLEKKAMEDLSQFYNANKDLSRAAIIKVFKQHKVLRKGLDIAKMWPSSIYVQIFPETDEFVKALNEYLESGQLIIDLQTEYEKIGYHGSLQGDVRSMEQLEEEVAEIVEEAMGVFVSSETKETGEDPEESTQTNEELRDDWRDALLKITAWTGDEDKVKTLLQAGVQVNTENSEGETPLWDAVRGGHSNIVRLLLQEGADPGAGANTASGTGKTLLQVAAESGNVEVVSILIQAGADLDKVDDEGRTALLMAAMNGHGEVVSILAQAGANLNMADNTGSTPLWWAAQRGHAEIVSILAQPGADLNKADKEGTTPLSVAAEKGHAEIVSILAQAGADLNNAGDGGATALWVAADRGHAEIVSILTQAGADLNKPDLDKKTPLWIAAFYGNMEIVKVLIEARADISIPDNSGKTPYQAAIETKHSYVAKVIGEGYS